MSEPINPLTIKIQNLAGVVENSGLNAVLQMHQDCDYSGSAFHYCDASAMFSILTKEVWLSDLAFMNDPSEGILVAEIIEILKSKNASPGGSDLKSKLLKHLQENAAHSDLADGPENSSIGLRYVLSMSREGDDLNLWRFYGDSGSGYSLEFEAAALKSAIELQLNLTKFDTLVSPLAPRPVDIKPVAYLDRHAIEVFAMAIVDHILDNIEIAGAAEIDAGNANILAWIISNRIYDQAYFYKRKDWESEHEVRCIVAGHITLSDEILRTHRSHHKRGPYLVPHINIGTVGSQILTPYGPRDAFANPQIVKSVTSGPSLDKHYVQRIYDQLFGPAENRYNRHIYPDFLKFSKCAYRS